MPYEEPSEAFFKTIQDNVLSRTIGEKLPEKKETKVFALNFKWVAAAAVVLIAGLTAFFSLNENPEVSMAQQKPIVDSTYGIQPATKSIVDNTQDLQTSSESGESKNGISNNHHQAAAHQSKSLTRKAQAYDNTDRQDYAVESNIKPEAEVEKVLAAFTPDQLKDLEKNSEQDVYLDLYN